jgi:signal peptide peptidase SppA
MKLLELLTSPWAIDPAKLCEIQEIYATHLRGEKIDVDAIEARLGRPLASDQQEYAIREGGVAVLAIEGVIAPKANLFTRVSGGASAQVLNTQVESAIADPRVKALVIQADSPGGSVFGGPELAATILELSKIKPIVTVSDGQMASLMYWIGSAANRVFISGPTVMVGSIGVVATHNYTPNRTGGQTTEITAGRYKRIASDTAPLSDEGRAYLQAQVDHIYEVFVDAVAQHRGVDAATVLEHMADGRVFVGQQAIDAGLVDGVSTVDAVVEKLATDPAVFSTRRRAAIKGAAPRAPAKAPAAGAAADAPSPTSTTRGAAMHMTREQLSAEAPDLLKAILAEGHAAGVTAGAKAELERIQAVEAQSMPGHEKLIAEMKFDGKTTGAEAAVKVLAAERQVRATAAADMKKDAPPPVKQAPADVTDHGKAPDADAGKPVEDRCKAKFESDPRLRAEFGTLQTYTAYVKASEDGNVRVLTSKKAAA